MENAPDAKIRGKYGEIEKIICGGVLRTQTLCEAIVHRR